MGEMTQGNGRQGFIFRLINTSLGGFLALYLSYHLVEVFLPALIEEMKAHTSGLAKQTQLLTAHVAGAATVERGVPLLINIATQDCVNNARASGESVKACFAVAQGEQPR